MKSTIILAFVIALAPAFSWADKMGPNGDKFYEEAAHFEGACQKQSECRAPFIRKTIYSLKKGIRDINKETREGLQEVSTFQAQIWGDTILEGDYVAAGETRLDEVQAYYRDSELLGYKIQYSEKAWYTGDCAYDGSKDSLNSCGEGRILETSYVSPDMQTFFSDEEQFAQFMNLN